MTFEYNLSSFFSLIIFLRFRRMQAPKYATL